MTTPPTPLQRLLQALSEALKSAPAGQPAQSTKPLATALAKYVVTLTPELRATAVQFMGDNQGNWTLRYADDLANLNGRDYVVIAPNMCLVTIA